jgi:hypothetical protein
MRNIGIAVLVTGCVMVCGCSRRATGVQVSDSSRVLIETIIKATESFGHPQAGRGTARVRNTSVSPTEEYEMFFVFNGNCSRSDRYVTKDGRVGEREVVWSMGRDVYVGLNPHNAVVHAKPEDQFYRNFGYDFHPDTFIKIDAYPVTRVLKAWLTSAPTIPNGSLTTECDGNIITIITLVSDSVSWQKETVQLDSSKGYRPISWSLEGRNSAIETQNISKKCSISWQMLNGKWYVASADLELMGYEALHGNRPASRISFRITDFSEDATISDEAFTLAGIGVPDGLRVVDSITGVTYRYGKAEKVSDKE